MVILDFLYHLQLLESDWAKRLQPRRRPLGMLLHVRGFIENISRWDSPTAWCHCGTLLDDSIRDNLECVKADVLDTRFMQIIICQALRYLILTPRDAT